MKGFQLTQQELSELKVAHRNEKNRASAYKLNAVILLGTGWKLKQVREALLIDDETLRKYVQIYRESGVRGLLAINYLGRSCYLTDEQVQLLSKELDQEIYLDTAAIVDYVHRKFNVLYSVTGMRDLLHRMDYVYKKPKLVPGNPDLDAQEIFAAQFEDFMLKKSGNVEVIFVDAVHPEHNAMAAYGWIKKGDKRPLKTNSGRQRLNLHGAINAETFEVTVIESETVNAESTIELLEMLNQKYFYADELKIILDNARYHYSRSVKDYLKENPRINLIFIPAYSPELNLIERLWRFFKKNVLYNQYHATLSDFRAASIRFFQSLENRRGELASLLGGGFDCAF